MTRAFDKAYWEEHWRQAGPSGAGSVGGHPPNPYLARESGDLVPGTADAGCGAGAEAIWLASRGWQVTAVDIASAALAGAVERATAGGTSDQVRWVEADLSRWEPGTRSDLVTTHYVHPAMPQLEFYDRIARWVAPGGTLLIVGHLQTRGAANPPAEASVTATAITARLDETTWEVVTAEECYRTLVGHSGRSSVLHDVVVRAIRRPSHAA